MEGPRTLEWPAVGRDADERGAGAAVRRALAPAGSRPPAVLVVLAALLVAGTVVASVAGAYALQRGQGPAGSPPAIATPPAAPPSHSEQAAPVPAPTAQAPAPPSDPRAVFADPALRALAEPFLAGPGVSCQSRTPEDGETERVACELGAGRTAVFTRTSPEEMRQRRQDLVAGRQARPGTVVSLRWRYDGSGTATRTGIPAGHEVRGEGVRVRYVDLEGRPRFRFDQDATGCAGDLALTRPTGDARADQEADLEELRLFWADPGG